MALTQAERSARWKAKHPNGARDANRRWRERNPDKANEWPAKRELGLWHTKYKEDNPCGDCGNFFPACAMDFDHRPDETKTYDVGMMVAHGHNKDKVMEEIAKCDLVCACCHRVRTRDRKIQNGRI
jgi:hypothetical protein